MKKLGTFRINRTFTMYFVSYLSVLTLLMLGFFFILKNQIIQNNFEQSSKQTMEQLSHYTAQINEEFENLAQVDASIRTNKTLILARYDSSVLNQLQIKEELIEAGYVKRKFTKKKVKIQSKPFHYVSSDGYHMYVGKNNIQNEELTFNFAVGNDWWFHAKGCPGSHVIVKTNGDELPDRTFEEAGKLAAYYSKNRGNDKVEIDYIEKKHVKKPKGGKPGFVVYYTNYSLMIDSDISGIKLVE